MSKARNVMENGLYEHCCVLTKNTVAFKFILYAGIEENDSKTLRLGSLAKIVSLNYDKLPKNFIALKLLELGTLFEAIDNSTWLVDQSDVVPLIPTLVQAFGAITSPSARIDIARNGYLCNELTKIHIGSKVYLCPEAELLQQNSDNWELAVVRYIGPIPELGSASHFYGLGLDPKSTQGDVDGSYCNRRYFQCAAGTRGTFVSINRLRPFPTSSTEVPQLQHSNSSMQTNRNNNESTKTKYKSTLVLQLKEQKNIPKTESFRVEGTKHMSKTTFLPSERSGKLIDVDSDEECPLHKGDRVVWMNDASGPEEGTVLWTGILGGYRIPEIRIGVEFDNPIGTGTGTYKGTKYFQTKHNHASFLPLHALLRAEDFFGKPEDTAQTKLRSTKSDDRSRKSTVSTAIFASKSDLVSKTRHSETPLWSQAAVVQLPDYQEKHSSTRDMVQIGDQPSCRSDYVLPEIFPNINVTKSKLDNASMRFSKDSKKSENSLDSYPIGEAQMNDYILSGSIPENQRRRTMVEVPANKPTKPTEVKIRHSYSRDGNSQSSFDATDFLGDIWSSTPAEVNQKPPTKEKSRTKLNINDPAGLEIVGLGMHINSVSKSNKPNDRHEVVQLSPNLSDCSDGSERSDPLDLGVGSVVEVAVKKEPRYGVIRWIGIVPEDPKCRRVAGIEMEEELIGCSDGTFQGRRYFHCNPKKALFVGLGQCKKDGRFQEVINNHADNKSKLFGPEDCPVIPGTVRPCIVSKQEDMDVVCGKYKGIQGHHNSCYLDATLFSMFAFSSAFDSLLFRPRGPNDTDKYEEVQRVLREEIVNPLRKNQFCRWDRVMKLRTLLENHSSVTGLTSEEKDPEEFLTSLVAQMLKAKPFLKLSSGQEAYHYQLFIDKDEHLRSPTVQQLFEQSFLSSDIKLKEVPSCLIIQMPRFGKSYKMYPRIFPSPLLDVTDIIEDSPRQCTVCGKLAEFECRECFGNGIESNTLESISFCKSCRDTVHSHKLRSSHKFRQLTVPMEFSILQEHCPIPRLYMHLFAVVCIETSHYVSFVKCGSLPDSPWCFFDSMADRKGEQNGYNIPEVVPCPDIPYWLSEEGVAALTEFNDDRKLPEHAKRLLCDAYMCMYQSTEMIMYK